MQVHIGYEHFLQNYLAAVILKPDSSPVKKLRHRSKEHGVLLDATAGHKTRSVIVLTTRQVVLSGLQTTTVKERLTQDQDTCRGIKVLFVNLGHEHFLQENLVALILKPDSSPTVQLRHSATEKGILIDATSGRKTRSVIALTTGQVVLSSLQTTTLRERFSKDGATYLNGKSLLVNIAYENFLNGNLVSTTLKPDRSPVIKLRREAAEKGVLINATYGHKTRSVTVLTTGQVVLSSLQTTTLAARLNTDGDVGPPEDGYLI
ncbi:MAG: extracellular matrix/biofilm biosynthesis regulator RemA family protein [Syntrophales bacterium]